MWRVETAMYWRVSSVTALSLLMRGENTILICLLYYSCAKCKKKSRSCLCAVFAFGFMFLEAKIHRALIQYKGLNFDLPAFILAKICTCIDFFHILRQCVWMVNREGFK